MHSLDYILRFQLRDWLTHGLTVFYVFTVGIGPAILGYCLGRWMPFYIRVIPLFVILPVGVWWVMDSNHWIEFYILGNLIYAYFCTRGLKRKAETIGTEFWKLSHFDWLIVVIGTILMLLCYDMPSA